jgi:pimeloyl-ACP methyl ester carboxylesterase
MVIIKAIGECGVVAEVINETIKYQDSELNVATTVGGDSSDLLVFVHGLGCVRQGFDGAFEVPALRDEFKILTLDLLGFGASDKPSSFSYELEDQANIVVEQIKTIAPQRLIIVGHSMGGVVGLLAAKQLDAELFINCEGNFVSDDAGLVSRRNADQEEAEFLATGYEKFVSSLEDSQDKALSVWANWCRQTDPLAFYRSARSLVAWSDSGKVTDIYQSLRHKAYIHGDHGEISSAMSLMPKDQVHSIPNSGHFMMIDNPETYYRVIAAVCLEVLK